MSKSKNKIEASYLMRIHFESYTNFQINNLNRYNCYAA